MKVIKSIGNFLLGIVLLIISILMVGILSPWGIIETFIKLFWKRRFWEGLSFLGELLKLLAVIVDVIGNVIMQVPSNRIMIQEDGYKFGSRFDTYSYVLGHNLVHGKLSKYGKLLCKTLDLFEKDHCIITYYKRQS